MHTASALLQGAAAYSWGTKYLDPGDSVTYFSKAVGVFKPLICIQSCVYMFHLLPLANNVSICCTTVTGIRLVTLYQATVPPDMEPIVFPPSTHVPGCLKCSRHCKGHPLPYGTNCTLALAKEHANESRDILACQVEGLPAILLLGEPPAVDQVPPVPSKQHLKPLARTAQTITVPLVATTTTITTRGSTEHSLAVLSTRVGQQDEQSAWDRQQIDKAITATQWHYYTACPHQQVLDHFLENHTPMAMMTGAPSVPVISSTSGTAPFRASSSSPTSGNCLRWGQSLHQQSSHQWAGSPTLQCRFVIAQLGSTWFPQSSYPGFLRVWTLLPWFNTQGQTNSNTSRWQLLQAHLRPPSTVPQMAVLMIGLATVPATGPQPYSFQTAGSLPHMTMDKATMAKVIPNLPPKLQQRIIQGEFIDLSELLQAGFQFKYASIDSNNTFELIHKDETVLMQLRKKGKSIDCLSTWLSAWALYE